jgi:GNAT superfamily N-acetyltransferase
MSPLDIHSVLLIQSRCYDRAKQESAASFLSKLASPLQSSFVAELGSEVTGYLVSVPVQDCCPLPLHDTCYTAPNQAGALYLHDLAVQPESRGFGVAAALIKAYMSALRSSNVRSGCLTAVNDSSQFWQHHGFRESLLAGPASARLADYGLGAKFMTLNVPTDSNGAHLD